MVHVVAQETFAFRMIILDNAEMQLQGDESPKRCAIRLLPYT